MIVDFNKLPKGWTKSNYFGFRVYHLGNEDIIRRIKQGKYEPKSASIVREWNGDSAIGFDVGANIGLFSLQLISSYENHLSKIYAFEPNPLTYARLQLTIEDNKLDNQITLFPLALGNKPGLVKFAIHKSQSCSGDGFLDTGRAGSTKDIFIQSTTIDDVQQALNLARLDWIKIDVEGSELLVIMGGEQTIKNLKPKILFEIHRDNIRPYGITPADIYKYLEIIGYRILDTNMDYLSVNKLEDIVEENKGDGNFIGIPRGVGK